MRQEDFEKLERRLKAEHVGGILRKDVPKIFGDLVSVKTLANSDSAGNGPKNSYMCRGRRCYSVTDLLDWLYGEEGDAR